MQRMLRRSQSCAQLAKGLWIGIVAVNVLQHTHQLWKAFRIQSAVVFNAVLSTSFQLLQIPSRLGYSDHGHFQLIALRQPLQRREDLLVGKVAGSSKEDQRVGLHSTHRESLRFLSSLGLWIPISVATMPSSVSR